MAGTQTAPVERRGAVTLMNNPGNWPADARCQAVDPAAALGTPLYAGAGSHALPKPVRR